MSRAFMKEPEPGDVRCPGCGGPGAEVGPATLDAQLPPEIRKGLGSAALYCADPGCATAYFSAWGATASAAALKSPAHPKHPEAPICPCFEVSADDLLADARDGRKERVKSLVERSKGPEARCVERNPDGRCCVPLALRLFREAFEASNPSGSG